MAIQLEDRIARFKLAAGIQDNPDQEGIDQFAHLILEDILATLDEEHLVAQAHWIRRQYHIS
jgi:hypothetical protein